MIIESELLEGTTAKYGIEYESIIIDKSKQDYICLNDDDKLYDEVLHKLMSGSIYKLLKEYDMNETFRYNPSLSCTKGSGWKRLEFASFAFKPSEMTPKEMFNNLDYLIEAFDNWTDNKYYLPDHGTIAYHNRSLGKVGTTVTGGTHMTISFPITIHDTPLRWKVFVWLFMGLVTMYQPMYISLNGAPSYFTKGSERQRVSTSVMIGSCHMYDVFTPKSERREIFINSPLSDKNYQDFSHWLRKGEMNYNAAPWVSTYKGDMGSSGYDRSDTFNLNDESVKEMTNRGWIKKGFENKTYDFIHSVSSMTTNLFEFRFFDNEPSKDLNEKFNLLVRIADYAYEQTKSFSEMTPIGDSILHDFLNFQADDNGNIRPLVNKKPWHDAVLSAMINGIDTKFDEKYIDECYEFLELTNFSKILKELKGEISAKDLHELFIAEMNTSPRHFSDYFKTDDPTNTYSKEYQIEAYEESKIKAQEALDRYVIEQKEKYEKAKLEEEALRERERQENLELENEISNAIDVSRENLPSDAERKLIFENIDFPKLTSNIRRLITEYSYNINDIKRVHLSTVYESTIDKVKYDNLSNVDQASILIWYIEFLLPELRIQVPILDKRERNREAQERQTVTRVPTSSQNNQSTIIRNALIEQLAEFDEGQETIITTNVNIYELARILHERLYIDNRTKNEIIENVDMIVAVSLNDETQPLDDFRYKLIGNWITDTLNRLIPENVESTRTEESSFLQLTKEAQFRLIHDVIFDSLPENTLENHNLRTLILGNIDLNIMAQHLQHWITVDDTQAREISEQANTLLRWSYLDSNFVPTEETKIILNRWITIKVVERLINLEIIKEDRGLAALFG